MTANRTPRHLLFWLVIAGIIAFWVIFNVELLRGALARNVGFLTLNHAQTANDISGNPNDLLIRRSIGFLESATSQAPRSESAWRSLGYLYLGLDDVERALAAWQHTDTMVAELLANGARAEANGEYDEALNWYQYAAEVDAESVAAWLAIGLIYEQKGDWDSAAAVYSDGISSAPDNSDLLYRLALAQSRITESVDWEAVQALVDRAIAQDNYLHDWSRAQSHYLRGAALNSLGKNREAMAEYRLVLKEDPDNYWAILHLAELIWKIDRDAQAAVQYSRSAITIDPGNKWAYRQLAQLLADIGRTEEAREFYQQVLRLDPNDQPAARWLAQNP